MEPALHISVCTALFNFTTTITGSWLWLQTYECDPPWECDGITEAASSTAYNPCVHPGHIDLVLAIWADLRQYKYYEPICLCDQRRGHRDSPWVVLAAFVSIHSYSQVPLRVHGGFIFYCCYVLAWLVIFLIVTAKGVGFTSTQDEMKWALLPPRPKRGASIGVHRYTMPNGDRGDAHSEVVLRSTAPQGAAVKNPISRSCKMSGFPLTESYYA